MILRPNVEFVSNICEIKAFKEVGRNIIIYHDKDNISDQHQIAIINVSIQAGSVNKLQANNELLYSINSYYGTIMNPLFYNPVKSCMDINTSAIVTIKSNSYTYKMIDMFMEDHKTVNIFDGEFNKEYALYKETRREILPSDPRFYNLDHQILVSGSESAFGTEDKLFSSTAREGEGIPYILNEFIDPKTEIRVTETKISDPYNVLKNNDNTFIDTINGFITSIINFALLAFVEKFTVILDNKLGFNILEAKKSFKNIEKKYDRFEVSGFLNQIKTVYEELLDSGYNIRITIVYMKYQTFIQIIPTDRENLNLSINPIDVQVIDLIESSFYSKFD